MFCTRRVPLDFLIAYITWKFSFFLIFFFSTSSFFSSAHCLSSLPGSDIDVSLENLQTESLGFKVLRPPGPSPSSGFHVVYLQENWINLLELGGQAKSRPSTIGV